MDIFNAKPENWVDLQDKVAYVLKSCGFSVETPRKMSTVRGTVEVDVYAECSDMLIICECKYWETKIPQNVILAFRTVVEDIGVNKGIIISKNGFQAGAYKNAKNTNLELRTWEEFLETYKEKYLKSYIKRFFRVKSKLYRVAVDKAEYCKYYDMLDKENQIKVNHLKAYLMRIVLQISPMCTMLQYEQDEEIGWSTDYLDQLILRSEKDFNNKFESYYYFFEFINQAIYETIHKIEAIYGISIL